MGAEANRDSTHAGDPISGDHDPLPGHRGPAEPDLSTAVGETQPRHDRLDAQRLGIAAMPYVFALAGLIAAAVTFLSITGVGPIRPASPWMIWLLVLNFVLILAIAAVLVRQLWRIGRGLRRPESGARLKLRFAALFGFAAVAPAAIVAAFLSLTLFRSVEAWFDTRVSTIVDKSVEAAQAYVRETVENLRGEVLAMAEDVDNARANAASDAELATYLRTQAIYRSFSAAYLVDAAGTPLLRAESDGAPPFMPPNAQTFANARAGGVAARPEEDTNVIRALYRLQGEPEIYLYVLRYVDGSIWRQLRVAQGRVREYRAAEARQGRLQLILSLAYLQTALLIFFAATWIGLSAANSIVGPISRLVVAARRVRTGDLAARVPARPGGDEIEALSRAFNGMTARLETQRGDLVRARLDAEDRSHFIETVLSGVSSGVLGLDADGRITLANRAACDLLEQSAGELTGLAVETLIPGLGALLDRVRRNPWHPVGEQLEIEKAGDVLHLNVRITRGQSGSGFIVTIDDTTRLVSAQRHAAWKDVARRIAHEIKNPLTPIQLATERLSRRYGPSIDADRETFDRCTRTILRQVSDIRRMVDEFSAFARMPAPDFAPASVHEILRDAVFAQRLAFPDIAFGLDLPDEPILAECDARILGQVFANLLKNSAEAIEQMNNSETLRRGHIEVEAREIAGRGEFVVTITDNGPGFPAQDRRRLFEPYVSTRVRGSGLGLAIVKRAIEDHGGRILLEDAPRLPATGTVSDPAVGDETDRDSGPMGARVRVTLPGVQPRIVPGPLPLTTDINAT